MKIAILGCGVMGTAFARQFVQKGEQVILCDHNVAKGEGLAEELGATFVSSPNEAVKGADAILLAVKPKDLEQIAAQIGKTEGQILISILAGATIQRLTHSFSKAIIIRAMPNLALTCGQSVIALVGDATMPLDVRNSTNDLLMGMGFVFWTEEAKIDAITALAGSGPAFVLAMIEAMTETGIEMGLSAAQSQELVLQTILGAVALLKQSKGHPGEIRWQIAAPAGTTIAGLAAFEESGVRAGIRKTILATYQRAKELL